MFASRQNRKCRVFYSRAPEKGATGDAFGSPWPAVDVYGFPPFSQVDRAISAFRNGRGCSKGKRFLLIAPSAHEGLRAEPLVVRRFQLFGIKLIDHAGLTAPGPCPTDLTAFLLSRAP